MSNALFFQKLPDERVVNLSQADIQAAHRHNGPWESPSNGVEPGEEIIISNLDTMTAASTASRIAYIGRVHRYLQRPWLSPDSMMLPIAARYEPRLVKTTPLGRDVVPEVKGIAIMSSSLVACAWRPAHPALPVARS